MAIPSKRNIDFDVYERQDPTTQVDWGAQATKITKKFEGIRDERQGRKDLLEKNIEEQRVALNDIGEYDSQNLRQLALKSSQQSADMLTRKAELMRNGKIKPNELMQFKSNQSAGWTLFKKNAENWNGKFVEYTERMNAVPPLSSKLEQQLAQSLAGFGNLENMSYLADDDGNMSYVRTDEEGNILPGESMSANELTNLLNQKIDNYDSVAAAKKAGDAIGTVVNEILTENGINATIRSDARSKAESDYFGSEEAAKVLRTHAETMTAVAQDLAVMMTQDVKIPNTDTVYEGDYGGKLHDAWAKENSDKHQSLNPYIAMRMKSGTYVPDVTKEQKAVATEYAEGLIKSTLNITIGVETKGMNEKDQKRGLTTYEGKVETNKNAATSYLNSLNKVITGTSADADAGGQDLVNEINKNKSKDANKVNSIRREYVEIDDKQVVQFVIDIENKVVKPILGVDDQGNPKTAEQIRRSIFGIVTPTMDGVTYDSVRDNTDLDNIFGEGSGGGSSQKNISKYNRTPVDPATGEIIEMEDWNAIASKHSGRKIRHLQLKFDDLIASRGFLPPALKDSVKSIESVNGQLVITIGKSEIKIDDYENVIGSKNRILIQKIQDAIEKENKRYNKGGGGGELD